MGCMKHMPPARIMKYVDELLAKYENMTGRWPSHYGKYECEVIEPTINDVLSLMPKQKEIS